jgi:hypothetical protein
MHCTCYLSFLYNMPTYLLSLQCYITLEVISPFDSPSYLSHPLLFHLLIISTSPSLTFLQCFTSPSCTLPLKRHHSASSKTFWYRSLSHAILFMVRGHTIRAFSFCFLTICFLCLHACLLYTLDMRFGQS